MIELRVARKADWKKKKKKAQKLMKGNKITGKSNILLSI